MSDHGWEVIRLGNVELTEAAIIKAFKALCSAIFGKSSAELPAEQLNRVEVEAVFTIPPSLQFKAQRIRENTMNGTLRNTHTSIDHFLSKDNTFMWSLSCGGVIISAIDYPRQN